MRFFLPEREKIEKFGIFRGKFPNFRPKPKMADPTQSELSNKKLTRPGSKTFDPDPSLA